MTLRLTEDEARARGFIKDAPTNKYHVAAKAKRTVDGIVFASKKEADFYCVYKALWMSGNIKMMLRQVPFHLPGGVKYMLDFMLFNNDGSVEFIDCKGMRTQVYEIKRKQVQEIYKIKIREV